MAARINKAVIKMLASAPGPLTTDPELVASVLQRAMAGVSRRLLKSTDPEKQFEELGRELISMACAYLDGSSTRASLRMASAAVYAN
jgi:hypothetical protein